MGPLLLVCIYNESSEASCRLTFASVLELHGFGTWETDDQAAGEGHSGILTELRGGVVRRHSESASHRATRTRQGERGDRSDHRRSARRSQSVRSGRGRRDFPSQGRGDHRPLRSRGVSPTLERRRLTRTLRVEPAEALIKKTHESGMQRWRE